MCLDVFHADTTQFSGRYRIILNVDCKSSINTLPERWKTDYCYFFGSKFDMRSTFVTGYELGEIFFEHRRSCHLKCKLFKAVICWILDKLSWQTSMVCQKYFGRKECVILG